MSTLAVFVAYELVWFAAVIGAGHGSVWPGVSAAVAFAVWRLSVSRHRALEARLAAIALLIGTVLQSAWAGAGVLHYAARWPLAAAPAWLLALWTAFGLTILPLFRYLHCRPWLAAAAGAFGGPLSYSAAAHGWHAVFLPVPAWPGLLALAVGWAIALPCLTGLAGRWLAADAMRSGA